MNTLLFELLTEDVPFSLQVKIETGIKQLFIETLQQHKIEYNSIEAYSTPRRIAVIVNNIATILPTSIVEKKGPSLIAGEKALQGFLQTNKVKLEDCIVKNTPKGDFYFLNIETKGGNLQDKLPSMIKDILLKVNLTKSMFWNHTKVKWARPIKGIILMLNDEVISLEFAGVQSSNKLIGHRFLGDKRWVLLKNASDYLTELAQMYVIVKAKSATDTHLNHDSNPTTNVVNNQPSRYDLIIDAITSFSQQHNLSYNNNPDLINEILYLIEYPVVLIGEIPTKYLALPKELIVTIMAKDQRYINFFNHDAQHAISKYFAIVSNLQTPNQGKEIIEGNQKVLNARLEDGLFFYNQDLQIPTSQRTEKLKTINFFEGLGSIFTKQQRVKQLATTIFIEDEMQTLCDYYKTDLASYVVYEIPELQGIMGGYYAETDGLSKEQSLAIKEHYLPKGPKDNLPNSLLGAKLAFLDKLDTIIAFYSINKMPTSSGDPFGIRRAALGIIRISIEYNINLDMVEVIENSLKVLNIQQSSDNLLTFFIERLKIYIKSLGVNVSIVEAIMNVENKALVMPEIYNKSLAIHNMLLVNTEFLSLYKRIVNLVQEHYSKILDSKTITVDDSLFVYAEEKALNDCRKSIWGELVVNNTEANSHVDYNQELAKILQIKPYLDEFLDKVLVVDSNIEKTLNRLKLLYLIYVNLRKIAYFEDITAV